MVDGFYVPFNESAASYVILSSRSTEALENQYANTGTAHLRSRKGQWCVSVRRENGCFCIHGHGCIDFVAAHSFEIGDFITFLHVGEFVFDVTVYDENMAEKSFEEEVINVDPVIGRAPTFETRMQQYMITQGYVQFSSSFVRACGFTTSNVARLIEESGQVLEVRLQYATYNRGRTQVRLKSLGEFFQARNVTAGRRIRFEFAEECNHRVQFHVFLV